MALCASTFLILGAAIFLYSHHVIGQFSLDVYQKNNLFLAENGKASGNLKNSSLEKGGRVNESELEAYFLLSREESLDFHEWLKELEKAGSLERSPKNKNEFLIKNTIPLAPLLSNYCEVIYCFGHRLPFAKIPTQLLKGLIGIEDYRYLEHSGVDFKSIFRAIITDLKAGSFVQGGSTLTQQLVKNLFLTNEKSWERKFKEAILSFYLEYRFTKEEILMAYLNEVVWGSLQNIRIKGVFAASVFYFNKRPELLSNYEVSILIGLLKGPYFYHPIRKTEILKKRADLVYAKLFELALIPNGEKPWTDGQWEAWKNKLIERENDQLLHALWETYSHQTESADAYEMFTFNSAVKKVLNHLKLKIQGEDIGIKAIVGDPSCYPDCPWKLSYYSKTERNKVNAVTTEKHQVGSILKPIILASFLKRGKSWDDDVSTDKITLNLRSGDWTPGEAHETESEEMTLLEVLQQSRNRPLIRVANEIGFDKIEEDLLPYIPTMQRPLSEFPSQLIGAIELPIAEIFSIYSKFIKDECQKVLEKKNFLAELFSSSNQEHSVLFKLSNPDETTIKNVVNESLRSLRFFGKTGTTNDGLDNWFVTYNGQELTVIWLGLEGSRIQKKLKLSGSGSAFVIFQNYMMFRGKPFSELNCGAFQKMFEQVPETPTPEN